MSTGEQKAHPSQFEKVKAITDQLEAGVQALFESEKSSNICIRFPSFTTIP